MEGRAGIKQFVGHVGRTERAGVEIMGPTGLCILAKPSPSPLPISHHSMGHTPVFFIVAII